MNADTFLDSVESKLGIDFYTGVPDSLLRSLCDALMERHGIGKNHIIAADEGGAVALAAGHYLATSKPGAVYMQNSGIGNAVNPICSLISDDVYGVPMLFVVGWRGEPGVHDEPQHVFQGKISKELLECVGLETMVLDAETSELELADFLAKTSSLFQQGKSAAILVRKGALSKKSKCDYKSANTNPMSREHAVDVITAAAPDGTHFVSTTGKLSRELFELREARGQNHGIDFLTVGSMGHSSMIGLGIALAKPDTKICVLDGDGALLMHTGALAITASQAPANYVHFLLNNGAHQTVGGMPNVSPTVDWPALAQSMGYRTVLSARTEEELGPMLDAAWASEGPVFAEVFVNLVDRNDLGRPTISAFQNGKNFMESLGRQS